VVSESSSPRRPVLTLDDLASPLTRRPERLYALSTAELALAMSLGLDLAEGKAPGHAQRVCYIASMLAEALELEPPQRTGVYFGALLHDAGVTLAASELCRVSGIEEDVLFGRSPLKSPEDLRSEVAFADMTSVVDAMHQHCRAGAETACALELPAEVANAIRGHHERWDGSGFPEGHAGAESPIEARVVAAADLAESIISSEHSSLIARRHLAQEISRHAGSSLDPAVVARLLDVARDDEFWLGLYSDDMTETLLQRRPPAENRKSRKRLIRWAEVFAGIADAKGGHTVEHSRRTADGAQKLAEAVGLDDQHAEMVRVAALLHNIGLLGVPARVMSKPEILSISEMQLMRRHPAHSEIVLQALNGFEEIALWVARHHERPDGKGYPEMLSGDEIPLESRIISVADVYAALTAERPHRGALQKDDAKQILIGAGGTQLDAELVRLFCTLI
jgi:HD-GYP domain-containing protein (c-di-GMP phosphodiesterase class II)